MNSEKPMTLLSTIKGTNMNKNRARTWLEQPEHKLAAFGFKRHARIDIAFTETAIIITTHPVGARKVAGKTKPDGSNQCIFDICYPALKRQQMFGGAAKLCVHIAKGVITIQAQKYLGELS